MTVRFREYDSGDAHGRDRESGLPEDVTGAAAMFPQTVLERHRAQILDPSKAPVGAGATAPKSTVYRRDTLLVSDATVRAIAVNSTTDAPTALDNALSEVGLRTEPNSLHRAAHADRRSSGSDPDDQLRPVRLTRCDGAAPGLVDAWDAAQALRAACPEDMLRPRPAGPAGLDHLMVGSACVGVGIGTFHGQPGGHAGNPVTDGPGSYARAGLGGRVPVELHLPAPPRRPLADLAGGRRVTIAVLDSGLHPAPHDWLDVAEQGEHADEFLIVDSALQQEIAGYWGPELAADPQVAEMATPWETRFVGDPLLGDVATHFGHGTFIAGIIRQAAPDARVRSIRVMHPDGVAYESTVLAALNLLAAEAEEAVGQGLPLPVDIVSLSLGYFDESPESAVESPMAIALDRLSRLGVIVVAAAGNYATSRRFYPAAFSDQLWSDAGAPLLSVAALNPNGTIALFSNDGPWVNCWATGAAVVSCYPAAAAGSAAPTTSTVDSAGMTRQTLDLDDFASGFAVWSGTSFAAPLVAAKLASAFADGADSQGVRAGLDDPADSLAKTVAAARGASSSERNDG